MATTRALETVLPSIKIRNSMLIIKKNLKNGERPPQPTTYIF